MYAGTSPCHNLSQNGQKKSKFANSDDLISITAKCQMTETHMSVFTCHSALAGAVPTLSASPRKNVLRSQTHQGDSALTDEHLSDSPERRVDVNADDEPEDGKSLNSRGVKETVVTSEQ